VENLDLILILSIVLIVFNIIFNNFSQYYALDYPDNRKRHLGPTSLIGGISFSSIFLAVGYYFGLLPIWFIVGGIVSILLGLIDDNFSVSWKFKLLVELLLVAYISYIFWGRFQFISFYNFSFAVSPFILLIIFSVWFIGIYNAVNLLDGLDGLAAGFIVLISIFSIFFGNSNLVQINQLLTVILVGYLIFNQRPGKVFMGDAGSLFLGFYVAVLPLIYMDDVMTNEHVLPMTPFVILATYLIADTTRVFFSRIFSGKNPMTADTIHFHHLIIKNSGSYLLTLGSIFLLTLITCLFSIITIHFNYGSNFLLIHMAFLFLFILTPPAPTYVKILSRLIKPLYKWQNSKNNVRPSIIRTILVMIPLIFLFILIYVTLNPNNFLNIQLLISTFFVSIFIYLNKSDKKVIPTIQVFITFLILVFGLSASFGVLIKLLTILLLITLIVFTFQRINGTKINNYSALDLLVIFISIGGVFLSQFAIDLNLWIFLILITIWFALGFLLRRIFLIL